MQAPLLRPAFPEAAPAGPGVLRPQGWRAWAYDRFFRGIHGHRLVYNACWEDPRIDRQLLNLGSDSRVVMIASAGCNALDYLLDGPEVVHAVDCNPRQIALLELKLALFRKGSYEDLERLFGKGAHPEACQLLDALVDVLPERARGYWKSKLHYLDGRHSRGSFYYHGSSGDVAWLMRTLVLRRQPRLWQCLGDLMEARSSVEQVALADQLDPLLWNRFTRWLVRQPWVMSLLGVPRPQVRLIEQSHPEGLTGFIRHQVRQVTSQVPMRDNYFWRAYITGAYADHCRPSYLEPEHFSRLRERAAGVRTHTTTLSGFLKSHPGIYSHFVLLDHQDWLAWHDPAALEEEWNLILACSQPGTRILFRSAAPQVAFLPRVTRDRVRFQPQLTDPLHLTDRVGTYGSLHLGVIQ